MVKVTCYFFFATTCYMLHGCNCRFRRLVKSVYRPYGPKMCMELCSNSTDSFLYLAEELTCYQIKLHDSRRRDKRIGANLPTCPGNNKLRNDALISTDIPGWDICNQEFEETGRKESMMISGKTKDNRCYQRHHHILVNRDITLIRACQDGELGVVKYILSHGIADVSCKGKMDETPVMAAAGSGQTAVFDFLVSQGSNLSDRDKYKNIVLHMACMGGSIDIVGKLLAHDCCHLESKGYHERTPILTATKYHHIGLAQYLVGKGCNVSVVDKRGYNILHDACMSDNINMVKYIFTLKVAGIESLNYYNKTPVMVAARHNKIDVVKYLMSKGCKLNGVDKYGDNILHFACTNGNVELVEFILAKGIVDIDSREYSFGHTPVMMAVRNGHSELVHFLFSKGCNVSVVDIAGNNILHLACLKNREDVVRYILRLGLVDIDSTNNVKKTPVMKAAEHNYIGVVKLLVRNECNLTAVDNEGNTILHLACFKGFVGMMKYLLSLKTLAGMEKDQNRNGNTPAEIAKLNDYNNIVALFKNMKGPKY